MLVGYARVSTADQNLDLQRPALLAAGCDGIYEDRGVSGLARRRPRLDAALAEIQAGDVLIVWRLDKLGRSLAHLIEMIDRLGKMNVGFRSLTESIDTTTAGGRLILHVMGALAEFERSLIVERTRAGVEGPILPPLAAQADQGATPG
jgi:DNA invertase Pin-like site-specific DNA recombinase